ncbi:MAG: hypothetical protein KAT46_03315 [Deltaproteobacteria bacterium]|nr:hypothetical protein [Deltaproteobacteria bacterium]
MKEIFSNTTSIVAWWGAVVATLVLLWDVYKWRLGGVKIKFEVSSGMSLVGAGCEPYEDKKFISLRVVSLGSMPTTITTVGMRCYSTFIHKLFRKPKASVIVPAPILAKPFPYLLEPGTYWQGFLNQDEEVENMIKTGRLYCWVCCTHTDKVFEKRLVIKDEEPISKD